jgi:hypothetical protein
MEKTANVGLFAVHRIVSEYAERIYVYMEKTQRDSWRIRRIRQENKIVYISVNIPDEFLFVKDFFIHTIWNGLSQKTISRYCPFKGTVYKKFYKEF